MSDLISRATQNNRVNSNNALDTISRQAAVDAIYALSDDSIAWLNGAAEAVKELPSAQSEIIRCKECRFYKTENMRCRLLNALIGEHEYCSYAERRTDETD